MAVYQRRTRVDAPFERVWSFYSRTSGLEALTPDWMRLRVESARGPDGEADPEVLDAGSELRLSVRPFGVGPRQSWTSRIVSRRETEGRAEFRDVMVDGPFDRWVHTHVVHDVEGGAVVDDRVAYELPCGRVGETLGPVAVVGFEPMFQFRHRRTRELLEGEDGVGGVDGFGDGDDDGGAAGDDEISDADEASDGDDADDAPTV